MAPHRNVEAQRSKEKQSVEKKAGQQVASPSDGAQEHGAREAVKRFPVFSVFRDSVISGWRHSQHDPQGC
jgi:hypothetical protein